MNELKECPVINEGIAKLKLDPKTLEFAIETAWQFRFCCKNTKEGRTKASAYGQVESVLKHYLEETKKIKEVENSLTSLK